MVHDSTGGQLRWDDLPGFFPEFLDSGRWLPLLRGHAELVEDWRDRAGLTAVEPAIAVRRHYAESIECWRIASGATPNGSVADVGPGAGFPGLVVAAVVPTVAVHLIESLKRRAAFLEAARHELGLTNVAVHPCRAEEAGRGPLREGVDIVLARAVAALPELLEYAAPLAVPGGRLAFPKGSSAPDEVAAAGTAATELGVAWEATVATRPEVSATPWVVLYRKTGPTPDRYPRRAGIPGKRPL